MFRSALVRAGSKAGTPSSGQNTKPKHVTQRPIAKPSCGEPSSIATPERPQTREDAWLEASLSTDKGPTFDQTQIHETVEEIIGLCSDQLPDDGKAADVVIDAQNKQTPIHKILRASEKLLSNWDVQQATLRAIRDDASLRQMIEELSDSKIEPVNTTLRLINAKQKDKSNPLFHVAGDIATQLSRFASCVNRKVSALGNMVIKTVSWLLEKFLNPNGAIPDLLNNGKRDGESKGAGLVLAFSMVVMIIMIVKTSRK